MIYIQQVRRCSLGIVALWFAFCTVVQAHEIKPGMGSMTTGTGGGHEAHEMMMHTGPYQKTIQEYQIPEISLLNQNGQKIDIEQYFDTDKPIVLDFIFTTCSTICPVLSATFSNFQKRMGKKHSDIQLVSVSIDPDNDTPEVLQDYLFRYDAWDSWDIFTGKKDNVVQVLKGFDAYVANKMDHFPLTLMRAPGSTKWVRLEGLLSAADLQKEYEQMMGQ